MKILLIHNYYRIRGGEETYLELLVKLLKEKGHEVKTYTKNSNSVKGKINNITTAFGMFWNFKTEKELSKIIKEFKPDIAHFNNIYPLISPTAYRICAKYHLPIVQTIHNYRFMCPKASLFRKGKICELCVQKNLPFYSILYGCYHNSRVSSFFYSLSFYFHTLIGTYHLIDKFIFPSEFTRDYYCKNLNLEEKKTVIIPYFVNHSFDQEVNSLKEKNYFLFVGRLCEEKGVMPLVEIFKKLPHIKLVIIGNGPLKKNVEEQMTSNITLIKSLPHEEVLKYIKNANCVVIPYVWYEVLPFVYIESIVSKTPILVLRNKNFETIIRDDKNYIENLYLANDFDDLKVKIVGVYNHKFYEKNSNKVDLLTKYSSTKYFSSLLVQYNNLSFKV